MNKNLLPIICLLVVAEKRSSHSGQTKGSLIELANMNTLKLESALDNAQHMVHTYDKLSHIVQSGALQKLSSKGTQLKLPDVDRLLSMAEPFISSLTEDD